MNRKISQYGPFSAIFSNGSVEIEEKGSIRDCLFITDDQKGENFQFVLKIDGEIFQKSYEEIWKTGEGGGGHKDSAEKENFHENFKGNFDGDSKGFQNIEKGEEFEELLQFGGDDVLTAALVAVISERILPIYQDENFVKTPNDNVGWSPVGPEEFTRNFYKSLKTESTPASVNSGAFEGCAKLHYLLGYALWYQEKVALATKGGEIEKEKCQTKKARYGGIIPNLHVKLEDLDVKTDLNDGIYIFPFHIAKHSIFLLQWLKKNLPFLTGEKFHVLHIDSEGTFVQISTESEENSCLIIHTAGLCEEVNDRLDNVFTKTFPKENFNEYKNLLKNFTSKVLRAFLLNRPDVFLGGDGAADPLSSASDTSYEKMENCEFTNYTDISHFLTLCNAQEGDTVGARLCRYVENFHMSNAEKFYGPFKHLNQCALHYDFLMKNIFDERKPEKYLKTLNSSRPDYNSCTCVCFEVFRDDMDGVGVNKKHDVWHRYPQSGAASAKCLYDSLHWVVLDYAIQDLIKARELTRVQRGGIYLYRLKVAKLVNLTKFANLS